MNKQDVVKSLLTDLETNPTHAEHYFTDDFKFSGPVPEPIDAHQWIQFHTALKRAFPDWKFNVQNLREENGKVTCTVSITGTHKQDLHLPDFPTVPASGKKINLPKEQVTVTFKGEKVQEVKVQKVPGGGIPGIYKQIGAELPSRVPA